jgi:hypothetical protein
VIGGAVLVGIGGYIATAIWTGAGKVLHPTGPPLEVHVVPTDVYNSGHPWAPYFIVPYSVAAGPEALPARARRSPTTFVDPMLVRDRRAVAGSPQIVRLRLRGLDDRPVTVNGIRALVTKRDRPVGGWYVAITPGCGGDVVRTAPIDLDRPSRPVAFRGLAGAREQIALSVTRSDIELVQLEAVTDGAVEWKARVDYSAADGDGSVTVDDGGRPFRVSSEAASRGYRAEYSGRPQSPSKLVRMPEWDGNGITWC